MVEHMERVLFLWLVFIICTSASCGGACVVGSQWVARHVDVTFDVEVE